jgi:prepilin-type N-terminal cleavage/methylation domain-containing protein
VNLVPNSKKLAAGFTLTEIMIVVSIIGLLAALSVPSLLRARSRAQEQTCIDNLRLLDGAKQQWALESKAISTSTPTAAQIMPYLGRGSGNLPLCPADPQKTFATSYSLNDCSTAPSCLTVVTHALQ